jgi:hypothetical protein
LTNKTLQLAKTTQIIFTIECAPATLQTENELNMKT